MNDMRSLVKAWADKIGREKAIGRLVGQTVSPRAAEMLCKGEYPSEPRALRRVLKEEMAKDGFTLSDDDAA